MPSYDELAPTRLRLWLGSHNEWTVTQPGGVLPLGVRFDLPFCLHLQNSTYVVMVDGVPIEVETEKVWRNSQDSSPDDSVSEDRVVFPSGKHRHQGREIRRGAGHQVTMWSLPGMRLATSATPDWWQAGPSPPARSLITRQSLTRRSQSHSLALMHIDL